jgi:hypothetical protein
MERYQFARCEGNNSCKKHIILESSQECAKDFLMDKFYKCCAPVNVPDIYLEFKAFLRILRMIIIKT